MSFEMRKINISEKDILHSLFQEIEENLVNDLWWLPVTKVSEEHFFDDDWTYFLGLYIDGKLIGASALFLNENEYGENISYLQGIVGSVAEIGRCMILPKYRGNSYMSLLNSELISYAKGLNINNLVATVHPDNIACIKTFEKTGFVFEQKIIKRCKYPRMIFTMRNIK